MSFTAVTITGSFERADGTPEQGQITATCSHALRNGVESIEPDPIVGRLDDEGKLVNESNGAFSLVANDDPATVPEGSWYSFVLELDSAPVRGFSAPVPHVGNGAEPEEGANPTIDLAELEA